MCQTDFRENTLRTKCYHQNAKGEHEGDTRLAVGDPPLLGSNPIRAGTAARSEDWRWSSLGGGAARQDHGCAGPDAEARASGPMASPPGRPDGSRGSMPWWPMKSSSDCRRASGAAGHLETTPGCGGRRGGWGWNQRSAIRGGHRRHRPRQKRRICECPRSAPLQPFATTRTTASSIGRAGRPAGFTPVRSFPRPPSEVSGTNASIAMGACPS
jgi:hypothetical protein